MASEFPRKLLDGERIAFVSDENRGDRMLAVEQLPAQQIAAAVQSIRAGGEAIDAALPPLTAPDYAKVRALDFPDSATGWTVVPAAAPAARPAYRPVAPGGKPQSNIIAPAILPRRHTPCRDAAQVLEASGDRFSAARRRQRLGIVQSARRRVYAFHRTLASLQPFGPQPGRKPGLGNTRRR